MTALPRQARIGAVVAGAVTGAAYLLSPLAVAAAMAAVPVVWWALRGLPPGERRSVGALLGLGLGLRLVPVVALVLSANHDAAPFATLFGDEQFFIERSIRLYHLWIGQPISTESFLYVYSGIGDTSYQGTLALLQVLFGQAPYAIRLFNVVAFVAGLVVLFRLTRRAYGSAPAIAGLALLLFLPSLFLWSVSALKESLYLLVTSALLASAFAVIRASRMWRRGAALLAACLAGVYLESLRVGGLAEALGGVFAGIGFRVVLLRRWATAAAVATALLVVSLMVYRGGPPAAVQERLRIAARYHRGQVFTPGHSYKLLDEVFYTDRWRPVDFPKLSGPQAARYVARSAAHFIAEPLPWTAASRLEVAYMPEQALWLVMLALVPVGCVVGWRRDPLWTAVLVGYTAASAAAVAITGGNVGTLVRHRALLMPYFGWLSALGFVWLVTLGRPEGEARPS